MALRTVRKIHPALVVALLLALSGVIIFAMKLGSLGKTSGWEFLWGLLFVSVLGVAVCGFLIIVLIGFFSKPTSARLIYLSESRISVQFTDKSIVLEAQEIKAFALKEIPNRGKDENYMSWSEVSLSTHHGSKIDFIIQESDDRTEINRLIQWIEGNKIQIIEKYIGNA